MTIGSLITSVMWSCRTPRRAPPIMEYVCHKQKNRVTMIGGYFLANSGDSWKCCQKVSTNQD